MKELGILFKGEMVRAILDGRKTLTSRLSGLDAQNVCPDDWRYNGVNINGDHLFLDVNAVVAGHDPQDCVKVVPCRYGPAGRRLWVRETWAPFDAWIDGVEREDPVYVRYKSDGQILCLEWENIHEVDQDSWSMPKWIPSIHMPRWASRITLKVVRVWPSRLQDMTEEEAKAEGIGGRWHPNQADLWTWRDYSTEGRFAYGSMFGPVESYQTLWDSINAKPRRKKLDGKWVTIPGHPWSSDPWVWRIQFKRV